MFRFEPIHNFHMFHGFFLTHQVDPVRHGLAVLFLNKRKIRGWALQFLLCHDIAHSTQKKKLF